MRRTTRAALALSTLALAALAACSSTHPHAAAAASAAAPIVSSSFSQAQLGTLETELTTAFQTQLTAHPLTPRADFKAALAKVFPHGHLAEIEAYAASKFTPAVLTSSGPGSVRVMYIREVVANAVTSGGATSAPSLPAASIPGTTPAPVSPSAPPTVVSPSASVSS